MKSRNRKKNTKDSPQNCEAEESNPLIDRRNKLRKMERSSGNGENDSNGEVNLLKLKAGKPTEDEIMRLAQDALKSWQKLGRALGLVDADVNEIEVDNHGAVYEQCYKMLKRWQQIKGSAATYTNLAVGLRHLNVKREDLVEKYCACASQQGTQKGLSAIKILPGRPFHKTQPRLQSLQKIDELYREMNPLPGTVTAVYLTGPPGSGKSQLAREYGQRFFDDGDSEGGSHAVLTLHTARPEALLESLREVCGALGVLGNYNSKDNLSGDIFALISRYSKSLQDALRQSNVEWLLIIDNLTAENPLREFWPQPSEDSSWGGGKVLITTQDNDLASLSHCFARSLSLAAGMEPTVALQLLGLISELEPDEHAGHVAQRLNYYPLSLACAAVYVREMRESRPAAKFGWETYFSNLTNYFEHLEYLDYTEHNIPYSRSMLSAAVMAVRRMAEGSDVLRATFEFLSHCALVQPVPLDAVARFVLRVTESVVPDVVKRKIARCSLLVYPRAGEKGIEVIACHQVMRFAFVRLTEELDKQSSKCQENRRLEEVLDVLNSTYKQFHSSLDQSAISERILLSPHLQECIGAAEKKSWTENVGFVKASVYCADSLVHVAGTSDPQRVSLLERAYEVNRSLGMKDLFACRLLLNLGYTYREAGLLHKVIPVLKEAEQIAESLMLSNEILEYRSGLLNVLAWTYREKFQLDLAKENMLMCVDVTREAYGGKHVQMVERLCNLGIILHDRWENQDAIKILDEARRLSAALEESEGFIKAQVLNYTAKVHLRWSLGLIETPGEEENAKARLKVSKSLHEEALGIYESLHGSEHKFNAGVRMTYGMVLLHLANPGAAMENCQVALRIFRDSGHIAWPRAATWLAAVLLARKEVSEARELLQEVMQAHSDLQLPVSPGAFHPKALLAEALVYQGEKEQGGKMLQECLDEWTGNGLHAQHYWIVRVRKFLEQYRSAGISCRPCSLCF